MANYSSPLFWQERYAFDPSASFDWYLTGEELLPHLAPFLSPRGDFEIFIPGCGNSTLGARLYEAGYANVSNVDISSVVIEQLRARYSGMTEMDFSVLDACNMKDELPDPAFDLIIDKALMDAVLCGEDAWRRVTAMVREMHRVLKPGGRYVVLSYGQPTSRVGYLSVPGCDWSVTATEIPKPRLDGFRPSEASAGGSPPCYYMYVCSKLGSSPVAAAAGAAAASAVASVSSASATTAAPAAAVSTTASMGGVFAGGSPARAAPASSSSMHVLPSSAASPSTALPPLNASGPPRAQPPASASVRSVLPEL